MASLWHEVRLRSDAVTSFLTNGSAAFIWKLHCHWLRGLRQRQIAIVIQGPGPCLTITTWRWRKRLTKCQRSFQKLRRHWPKRLCQRHVAMVRHNPGPQWVTPASSWKTRLHYSSCIDITVIVNALTALGAQMDRWQSTATHSVTNHCLNQCLPIVKCTIEDKHEFFEYEYRVRIPWSCFTWKRFPHHWPLVKEFHPHPQPLLPHKVVAMQSF